MTTCSCSPTVFVLKFDFARDCSRDETKDNGGIRGTLCLLDSVDENLVLPPGGGGGCPPGTPGCDGEVPETVPVPAPGTIPPGTTTATTTTEFPTYLVDDDDDGTASPTAPSAPSAPAAAGTTIAPVASSQRRMRLFGMSLSSR